MNDSERLSQLMFKVGELERKLDFVMQKLNLQYQAQPLNTAPFIRTWEDRPAPYALHDTSLGSKHPGGCHILMADGSASFLQENVDLAGVLKAMASRDSEEVFAKTL